MLSPISRTMVTASAALLLSVGFNAECRAQLTRGIPGMYQPLDQTFPPGVAAQWTAFQGKAGPPFFQPILVTIDGGGYVTFYNRPPAGPALSLSPARAAVMVGHTYRLRLSDMPELPGVELYPSIEILDRLHPPPGVEDRFPLPVEFTRDEIEAAIDGRLVTKVVYVEQPNLAAPIDHQTPLAVTTLPPHVNLLAEADLRGRPVMIIRLGGRTPDPNRPDPGFFGYGAPVLLPVRPAVETDARRAAPRAAPNDATSPQASNPFAPQLPRNRAAEESRWKVGTSVSAGHAAAWE